VQHKESIGTGRTLIFNFPFVLEIIDIHATSNFSKNKLLIHDVMGKTGEG
jgi:hypothetical protein